MFLQPVRAYLDCRFYDLWEIMNLKEVLKTKLSQEKLDQLVSSYDVVGDIAIVRIPESLILEESEIAQAILSLNKRVKVVVKKAGYHTGAFRQIPVTIIGGEQRKETLCKENGVLLKLHVEEVYYSVRQAFERKRIAELVHAGEEVLVMFSGVAPFPLVIAKNSEAAHITGVEMNPIAHQYGCANLQLNRKLTNISLINGDVHEVLVGFNNVFDRVIMPLPKVGILFVAKALSVLKKGGYLHLYTMQDKQSIVGFIDELRKICAESDREIFSEKATICGHCSPRIYRWCVDCIIL